MTGRKIFITHLIKLFPAQQKGDERRNLDSTAGWNIHGVDAEEPACRVVTRGHRLPAVGGASAISLLQMYKEAQTWTSGGLWVETGSV